MRRVDRYVTPWHILGSAAAMMLITSVDAARAQQAKPAPAQPKAADAQSDTAETTTPSEEDTRTAARTEFNAGTEAFNRGDYENAYDHFETANELIPTPHAQFWMAQSLDKQDKVPQAIAAYEVFLAHQDALKVGEESVALARARLEELKRQQAAAEPEPEPEPPAAILEPVNPMPPPPPVEERPRGFWYQHTPESNMWELGLFTGALLISNAHRLHEEGMPRRAYSLPTWLFGIRAAYFPLKRAGIEIDYARGEGSIDRSGNGASFNIVRGHVIAQLDMWRLVPFVSFGAGAIHATSNELGSDVDVLIHGGLGAKLAVNELFSLRLDFREDMTESSLGGLAFSEEILLGASLTLGRD